MFLMLIWGRAPQTTTYWKLVLKPDTDSPWRTDLVISGKQSCMVSGALKWGKCTNQHVKKLNHSGNNQLGNAVFQYEFIFQSNLKLQIYTVNLLVGDKYYIIYCINYIVYCIYLEYFTILFSPFILSAKEPSPTVHCVLCGLNVTSQSEGKITIDSWWQMILGDKWWRMITKKHNGDNLET